LFCQQISKDLERNLEHMTMEHGFFLPDLEYLKDIQGLIKYLGEKIAVGHTCLYCNGKGRGFYSLEAVQGHMRSLNHCKLLYEDNEDEYGDFYDFSVDYGTTEEDKDKEVDPVKTPVRLSEDGSQLLFENGKAVGHREYVPYYRQRYRPEDNRDSILISKLSGQYKALGWHESTVPLSVQKRQAIELRVQMRNKLYDQMRMGQRTSGLQRHFRDSNALYT